MTPGEVLLVGGAGVAGVVAWRALRRSSDIPATVSAHATRIVTTMRVDPCGGTRAEASDFVSYYVQQKIALGARFGTSTEKVCSVQGGFGGPLAGIGALGGVCVPNPFKSIPANVPRACELAVIDEWVRAVEDLLGASGDESFTASLRDDLQLYSDGLKALRGIVAIGDDPTSGAVNDRVWSAIGRIAVDLQGVQVHNGDARQEARDELVRTVTDPTSYLTVLADVAGWALGSPIGAAAVVAGAGYLAWRLA